MNRANGTCWNTWTNTDRSNVTGTSGMLVWPGGAIETLNSQYSGNSEVVNSTPPRNTNMTAYAFSGFLIQSSAHRAMRDLFSSSPVSSPEPSNVSASSWLRASMLMLG